MINKTLVRETIKEATKLRQTATKGELRKLVLKDLKPTNVNFCVYGQMTGNCTNARAKELLKASAIAVSNSAVSAGNASCQLKPTGTKANLLDRNVNGWGGGRVTYLSAIETYIMEKGADNKKLLSFLRGRTEVLDLSHTINC